MITLDVVCRHIFIHYLIVKDYRLSLALANVSLVWSYDVDKYCCISSQLVALHLVAAHPAPSRRVQSRRALNHVLFLPLPPSCRPRSCRCGIARPDRSWPSWGSDVRPSPVVVTTITPSQRPRGPACFGPVRYGLIRVQRPYSRP